MEAFYEFENGDWIYPGETVDVTIHILDPVRHSGKFSAGDEIQLFDGPQLVATGCILTVETQ
jgi:hypothetical protein